MNMKESLSVNIAHRHVSALGTTYFKNQMISQMKPEIKLPKKFYYKTIRSSSITPPNDSYKSEKSPEKKNAIGTYDALPERPSPHERLPALVREQSDGSRTLGHTGGNGDISDASIVCKLKPELA